MQACQTAAPKDAAPAVVATSRDRSVRGRQRHDTIDRPIAGRQVTDVLRSPGHPLDADTSARMESRFGHDFSQVRVHTGPAAAASARAVNARAYTFGSEIVFGPPECESRTPAGQQLLAHEMAHVVQQQRGAAGHPGEAASSSIEREANAAASAFTSGDRSIDVKGASPPRLARQPLFENALTAGDEPRSLTGSISRKPEDTNDAALAAEIRLLKKWIDEHPNDANHFHLSSELMDLDAEMRRRKTVSQKPRRPSPRVTPHDRGVAQKIIDARNCSVNESGFRELLRRDGLEAEYRMLMMTGKLHWLGISPKIPEPHEPEYWENRIPQDLKRPIAIGAETKFNEQWKRECIEQPGDQGDDCEDVEVSTWTMTRPALRAYLTHMGQGLTEFEEQLVAGNGGFDDFTPIAPGSKLLGYYVQSGGSGNRYHTVYDRDGKIVEQFATEAPLVNMGIGPIAFVIPGGRIAGMARTASAGAINLGKSILTKLSQRAQAYTIAGRLRMAPAAPYLGATIRGADEALTPLTAGGGAGMGQTSSLVVRSETAAASRTITPPTVTRNAPDLPATRPTVDTAASRATATPNAPVIRETTHEAAKRSTIPPVSRNTDLTGRAQFGAPAVTRDANTPNQPTKTPATGRIVAPAAVIDAFIDRLNQPGNPFDLNIGEKRAQQIQSGEKDFVLDKPITFDVDEPLAVGDPNIKRQRAVHRATDPHNRQLLDPATNRTSKHLRENPADVARHKQQLPAVSLRDNPSALFTRRFDEVTELNQVFRDAVARVRDPGKLTPTAYKNAINKNFRDMIKNGSTPAAATVRDTLRAAGFEYVEQRGFVAIGRGG